MNGARRTPAEDTAAILVQAARSGTPVLIPGAFEKRTADPAAELRKSVRKGTAESKRPAIR